MTLEVRVEAEAGEATVRLRAVTRLQIARGTAAAWADGAATG